MDTPKGDPAKMGAATGGPVIPGQTGKPPGVDYPTNGTFNGLGIGGPGTAGDNRPPMGMKP